MFKSLGLGYLNFIISSFSNILLLPVVYKNFTEEQTGLWFNFVTIYTFMLLLDLGITATASRAMAKTWHKNYNKNELGIVINGYKKIYKKISNLALLVGLVPGVIYLYKIGVVDSNAYISWLVYALTCGIYLRKIYLIPLMKALGNISVVYGSNIIAKISYLLISVLTIEYFDAGLLGVSIAFFISNLVNIFILTKNVDIEVVSDNSEDETFKNIENKKIWRQAYLSMSVFFQDKCTLFYVTSTLGLLSASQFGLTAQIFAAVTTVSNVYYNTMQPIMIKNIANNNRSKNKKLMAISIISQFVVIGTAYFLMSRFGGHILSLFDISGQLIPENNLFTYVTFLLVFNIQLICVNYLLIEEIYSMVVPYVASSIVYFLAMLWPLMPYSFDYLIGTNLLILLLFNGWFWPVRLFLLFRSEKNGN